MAIPLSIEWIGDHTGFLRLLDQTRLPLEVVYRDCLTVADVWEAIRSLRVRGAPAIGVAAAFGTLLSVREVTDSESTTEKFLAAVALLRTSRPTAVNLFWSLDRMERCLNVSAKDLAPVEKTRRLFAEARAIRDEDARTCHAIGQTGAFLIKDGMGVLTHCNTGGLATAEFGTALAVMFTAAREGRRFQVYADETRPLLQGARLTTWELLQHGIPVTLLCDSMAGQVMKERRVQMAIVGADRIAANGDTANKIGTYGVAVLARAHDIPFYVAAPSSTFDFHLESGEQIPIEQRDPREVTHSFGKETAPEGVTVYNPAFDVTPNHLITGLITEKGLIQPVNRQAIYAMLG